MWSVTLVVVAARCASAMSLSTPGKVSQTSSRGFFRGADPQAPPTSSKRIRHTASLFSAGQPSSHAFNPDTSATSQSLDLRLCNAYTYEGWVHVDHSFGPRSANSYTTSKSSDKEARLTEASGPLPFKRCTDVLGVVLGVGSVLNFRIAGDMTIGSFVVQELPSRYSMLQLILKRRDTWSTAADFSSHVFADTDGPQIALVDAYLGPGRSELQVRDVPVGFEVLQKDPGQFEPVMFGTVLDIAAGDYEWRLMDAIGPAQYSEKASIEFKAVGRKPYTILRVGTEAIGGQSYPEELIVWPADGAVVHKGFASRGAVEKGLFGIPTQRARRSVAQTQLPGIVALLLTMIIVATQLDQV